MNKREEKSYLRRCEACGQFMNWRVHPDGSAMCLNCGTTHSPLPTPTAEQYEAWEKMVGNKKPKEDSLCAFSADE